MDELISIVVEKAVKGILENKEIIQSKTKIKFKIFSFINTS